MTAYQSKLFKVNINYIAEGFTLAYRTYKKKTQNKKQAEESIHYKQKMSIQCLEIHFLLENDQCEIPGALSSVLTPAGDIGC